jgi:hypothetical protein
MRHISHVNQSAPAPRAECCFWHPLIIDRIVKISALTDGSGAGQEADKANTPARAGCSATRPSNNRWSR